MLRRRLTSSLHAPAHYFSAPPIRRVGRPSQAVARLRRLASLTAPDTAASAPTSCALLLAAVTAGASPSTRRLCPSVGVKFFFLGREEVSLG